MKKHFDSYKEMKEFLNSLLGETKYVVDINKTEDDSYDVQWKEHLTYIAQDGKVYPDEAWMTKNGELKLIQELEEEHAKNILRMIIRKEREVLAQTENLADKIIESIKEGTFGLDMPEENVPQRTLH